MRVLRRVSTELVLLHITEPGRPAGGGGVHRTRDIRASAHIFVIYLMHALPIQNVGEPFFCTRNMESGINFKRKYHSIFSHIGDFPIEPLGKSGTQSGSPNWWNRESIFARMS